MLEHELVTTRPTEAIGDAAIQEETATGTVHVPPAMGAALTGLTLDELTDGASVDPPGEFSADAYELKMPNVGMRAAERTVVMALAEIHAEFEECVDTQTACHYDGRTNQRAVVPAVKTARGGVGKSFRRRVARLLVR
jgi:hypothetical protein